MIQLDFLRHTNVNEIINTIKKYEVVSFDIFDTLLKRDVSSPTEVFRLIEEKIGENFSELRIQAEKKARTLLNKEEVTLEDIYHFLPQSLNIAKDMELKCEKELLGVNTAIFPIYEYCRKNQKKLLLRLICICRNRCWKRSCMQTELHTMHFICLLL